MQNFVEPLLLSDLRAIVEARAAELTISMATVLERVRVSESEWTRAADMDVLLRAAREVGIDFTPENEASLDPPCETPAGSTTATHSSTKRCSAPFPVLRPSGTGKRLVLRPAGDRIQPTKAE
jgi:hypothetical protein